MLFTHHLFGPLALPLLMALLKELQGIVKGWKASRIKQTEEKDALIVKEGREGESTIVAETTEPISK